MTSTPGHNWEISDTTFDVVVLGAGINGAGIARDASLRGLRVLLLDKSDIGSGTSAASTRLIHGGLRYLEHGEIGLVRESLREREILLKIAPHLVRPLPLLVPIYAGGRRGLLTIRAGMIAYDILSYDKSLASHHMLSDREVRQHAPGLRTDGLVGGALYHDAQVEFAERLVLENALAARSNGATITTHALVRRLIIEDGTASGVQFTASEGSEHVARAKLVVNAAGPWVDDVFNSGFSVRGRRLIGGTKGSHIVVAKFSGAPDVAVYAEARSDGRPFFVIPWNGKFLIGTTDKRFEGDVDHVVADQQEIAYLVDETNRLFPDSRLDNQSVLFTYSGIRPLPASNGRNEASITRRHFVHENTHGIRNVITIIGGKLTTYRSLSEEVVDLLLKKLGRPKVPCRTNLAPLPGGFLESKSSDAVRESLGASLPPQTAETLVRVYGRRALDVARLASEDSKLSSIVCEETGSVAAQIVFAFHEEMATSLQDCLLRRTMIGLNSSVGLNAVERAAHVARLYLNWDDERTAREIDDYRSYVAGFRPLNVKTEAEARP